MGWFSKFIGGGVAEPIRAIDSLIDNVTTTDEERDAAEIIKMRIRQEPSKLQSAIMLMEAQHRSVFVAGGRPFIIWVCGWSLAYMWPIRMMMSDVAVLLGYTPLPATSVSAADVVALLGPILGLGALRTGEKMAGKAK